MMYMLGLLIYLLLPRSSLQGVPNLEGVPAHLREKILSFHRTLEAPDNFSTTTTTAAPRYQLAGLAEVEAGADSAPAPRPSLDLQQDILRFSGRLSTPQSGSNIYARIARTKERKKERLEREWRQFLKWRKKQRKRKKMRKRIMKMLKRKIEKRFGPLTRERWNRFKQDTAFKDKKTIIRQKIRSRMRETRQRRKLRRKGPRRNKNRRRRL